MTLEYLVPKIIYTAVCILVIVVSRSLVVNIIKQYAKTHQKMQHRTNLVIKYFDFAFMFIFVFWNILIWGVDFSDVGLVFSSVFAVIGVALFAQWSILSNVTAGMLMFFTFPYKIGDKIKIHDKDFITEPLTIDDIRTFHTILKTEEGEIHSYPNNLILQKGITMISVSQPHEHAIEDDKNLTKTHD